MNDYLEDYFKDDYSEKTYEELMDFLSIEFKRLLVDNGSLIIFVDRNKPYLIKSFYKAFSFKNTICFVKGFPAPHIRKNNYRSGFELCYWFCKGKKPKSFNFLSQREMINVFNGFIGAVGGKVTKHPTEKYIWMIEPLILRHSNEGDVILDCFCGSGTIIALSKKWNRKYIGIDNDPKSYEIASNRVEKTIPNSKNKMF